MQGFSEYARTPRTAQNGVRKVCERARLSILARVRQSGLSVVNTRSSQGHRRVYEQGQNGEYQGKPGTRQRQAGAIRTHRDAGLQYGQGQGSGRYVGTAASVVALASGCGRYQRRTCTGRHGQGLPRRTRRPPKVRSLVHAHVLPGVTRLHAGSTVTRQAHSYQRRARRFVLVCTGASQARTHSGSRAARYQAGRHTAHGVHGRTWSAQYGKAAGLMYARAHLAGYRPGRKVATALTRGGVYQGERSSLPCPGVQAGAQCTSGGKVCALCNA